MPQSSSASASNAAIRNLADQVGLTARSPQTIGSDVSFFSVANASYVNEASMFFIEREGVPLTLYARNVTTSNCGPLFRTASNAMAATSRNISILLEDCTLDGNNAYKHLALQSVGITRATIQRCSFTRAEKASVQIGESDLFQTRRKNITLRDCEFDGVLDRGSGDYESHAIFLLACQGFEIDNCKIRNVESRGTRDVDCEGIYTKARDGKIVKCELHNAGFTAISIKANGEPIPYAPADPNQVLYGDRVRVESCHVTADAAYAANYCRGMLVNCGGHVEIRRSSVRGMNDSGIVIEQPNPSTGSVFAADNYIEGGTLPVFVRRVYAPCYIEGNRARGYSAGNFVGIHADQGSLLAGSRNTDNIKLDA